MLINDKQFVTHVHATSNSHHSAHSQNWTELQTFTFKSTVSRYSYMCHSHLWNNPEPTPRGQTEYQLCLKIEDAYPLSQLQYTNILLCLKFTTYHVCSFVSYSQSIPCIKAAGMTYSTQLSPLQFLKQAFIGRTNPHKMHCTTTLCTNSTFPALPLCLPNPPFDSNMFFALNLIQRFLVWGESAKIALDVCFSFKCH